MTRSFARFVRREHIERTTLLEAVDQADRGFAHANLGGHVVKLRVARRHEGKSGGYRTIVIFQRGTSAFFVYGFPKNARSNISGEELAAFKSLADELLGYTEADLVADIDAGALIEIAKENDEGSEDTI